MRTVDEIQSLYQKRARYYDFTANLYYLIGFREYAYRKAAVAALDLKQGGTVLEIGCGTGLNFGLLQQKVGPQGKIIGLDLTPSMLSVAYNRCMDHGWKNVELIEQDAETYKFPQQLDAVISTFALTLVPEYKVVIDRASTALGISKKMVIGDFRLPAWPNPLIRLAVLLTSPFGVSLELGQRHPWETMQNIFGNLEMQTYYFGAVYIASSVKQISENQGDTL